MTLPTRLARLLSLVSLLVVGLAASACGDRTSILPVGFLDASVPDASHPHHDGAICGPSTCPHGCCNASDECLSGLSSSDCGKGGAACAVCVGGEECNSTAQKCEALQACSEGSCPGGCCDSTGNCQQGTASNACGGNGLACVNCVAMGQTGCDPNARDCTSTTVCSASTCPTGCCDGNGNCQSGTSLTACGDDGHACENCPAEGFTVCAQAPNQCQGVPVNCSPANCPNGCCQTDLNGQQSCVGGNDDTLCGTQGQACQDCQNDGLVCSGQTCATMACSPANCNGCCFQNTCIGENGAPPPPGLCGAGGNQCLMCNPGQQCVGGQCESTTECGPGNCAGCCGAAGVCRVGTRPRNCGTGGTTCMDCGTGTCSDGFCITSTTCGPGSCTGCCDASGNCQPGNSTADCGGGGNACAVCEGPTTQVCQGGSCETVKKCNASTCPSGCCDTHDICQVGDTTAACGMGTGECAVCSPGAECLNGTCEGSACSAATCPTGCCDENGACQPGNLSFECGTGGGTCNGCDATSQCIGGSCVETACNEETCSGCCDASDNCQVGTATSACGEGGNTCEACPATGFCQFGVCEGFTCGPATCPTGCCDTSGNCQTGFGGNGGMCPCAATCEGCCDGQGNCHAGTIDTACGSSGATCVNCTPMNETCDTEQFPVVCDQSCPAPYGGCGPGLTMAAPQPFPNACHPTDITDAAAACAAGAATVECEMFFNGEEGSNFNCAQCLQQFDFDFIDLTGVYTCAQPFLSPGCNGSTGCANDCATTVCEGCAGDQTACETAAVNGECSTLATAANACVKASAQASALCAPASYPNFGAWLAAVGKHYCVQ